MGLPYGFKAKANRIALDFRKRLGLKPESPIDLNSLAEILEIPIVPLSAFRKSHPDQVRQLTRFDRDAFSAVLIPLGGNMRILLVNDSHSRGRQNSSIAHELSHVILKHPPTALFDSSGKRNYDDGIEGEANCLAGLILITNEAAMYIVDSSLPPSEARDLYGVSNDMLQYRLNISGARLRAARTRKYSRTS
ncbi:MAG: ImmA/IrrE family metallo-endopeptidase [Salinivirgaceae bacterium]|nr:ImmA/IrrE family metallo-endopeptidase [Salinivirgaceae bacterium]